MLSDVGFMRALQEYKKDRVWVGQGTQKSLDGCDEIKLLPFQDDMRERQAGWFSLAACLKKQQRVFNSFYAGSFKRPDCRIWVVN